MSDMEVPPRSRRRARHMPSQEIIDARPSFKLVEGPPKWEYLVQELERDGTGYEISQLLQEHGKQGWEFAGTVRTVKIIPEATNLGIPTGRQTVHALQSLVLKRIKPE